MLLFFRVFLVIVWILLLLPYQLIFIFIKSKLRFLLPVYFHKILLKILGIRLSLLGKPSNLKPLVLVGNHCSYLDIIILSSLLPVCFVAKSEIKKWFFFGFLAKIQNSIFIDRNSLRALDSFKKVSDSLSSKFSVIIFPEGTTNNGKKILKFRTSLFKVFEDNPTLRLQNFSLCYTHINNMPLDNRFRPTIAWYGGMNMITHLARLLSYSSVRASVVFHPVSSSSGINRKELTNESRKQVIEGINLIQNQKIK